jgi:L-glyceraldehyde 3-phosphate reductase
MLPISSELHRRAGRSGVVVSPLSLGLWQNFGENRPFSLQRAIVRAAFDAGITYFDLANDYGPPPGAAEETFGRILVKDLGQHRDEFLVSTKAGYRMWPGAYGEWGSRKSVLASLDQSLGRLGLDHVDIFYSHRFDPMTPLEETVAALATAVQQGKSRYIGISNYSADQTRAASEVARALGVPLLANQVSYSMFNRSLEAGLLPVLADAGMGAVVYSPLEQGLLSARYLSGDIPADSRAVVGEDFDASAIREPYLSRARGLERLAKDRDQSLSQLALAWVLRHEGIATAIIGASSVEQLHENVAALDSLEISESELDAIEQYAVDGTGF